MITEYKNQIVDFVTITEHDTYKILIWHGGSKTHNPHTSVSVPDCEGLVPTHFKMKFIIVFWGVTCICTYSGTSLKGLSKLRTQYKNLPIKDKFCMY